MTEGFRLRKICLQYPEEQDALVRFLRRHALHDDANIESAFGIFDENAALIGCGCAAGDLLKCFAVEPELRGQNALGPLVSALTQERFSTGHYDLFVITRAYNEALFKSCGYFTVVRTDALVMLENRPDGPEAFCRPLKQAGDGEKSAGAIVMNANPFTLGHRYLVEYAAARCDILHIFVVEENRSAFPTEVRFRLVREGTADLKNVRVHLSGRYIISDATFPTYFIKENEDAAALQTALDITLFAQRIAPALHIAKRFAGQEPLDPVTARYNDAMRTILPRYGLEFCETPRIRRGEDVISASRVRSLLESPETAVQARELLPESTWNDLMYPAGGAST